MKYLGNERRKAPEAASYKGTERRRWRRKPKRRLVVGLGVLALTVLTWGDIRVHAWENRSEEDAPEGDFVTLPDGVRIHYVAVGEGEPVILLHGFLDSLYAWRRNVEALAKRHRVYVIDLPGFGYSSRTLDPIYSLRQFASWVAGFMQELGIPSAHLGGHSLGGAICLQLSYQRPELVHTMVLEAAQAYRGVPEMPEILHYLPRTVTRSVLSFYMTGLAIEAWSRHHLHNPWKARQPKVKTLRELDGQAIRLHRSATRVKGSVDALVAMAESPREQDLRRAIRTCIQPTLIVWGRCDRMFPVRHGELLARQMRSARIEVLPQAGHMPHKQFADEVNRLMLEFWAENAIGPAPAGDERTGEGLKEGMSI